MGKQTLYHPVPLSTVRGAADYCGRKFGRITQKKVLEGKYSVYQVRVEKIPDNLQALGIKAIFDRLSSCFNDEVILLNILMNQRLWCEIRIATTKEQFWKEHFFQAAHPETIPF